MLYRSESVECAKQNTDISQPEFQNCYEPNFIVFANGVVMSNDCQYFVTDTFLWQATFVKVTCYCNLSYL